MTTTNKLQEVRDRLKSYKQEGFNHIILKPVFDRLMDDPSTPIDVIELTMTPEYEVSVPELRQALNRATKIAPGLFDYNGIQDHVKLGASVNTVLTEIRKANTPSEYLAIQKRSPLIYEFAAPLLLEDDLQTHLFLMEKAPEFLRSPKPTPKPDAWTCGFIGSGMGGGTAGVLSTEHYKPSWAIDYSGSNEDRSLILADTYQKNFGTSVIRRSVQDVVAANEHYRLPVTDFIFVTLSCTNATSVNLNCGESADDISSAKAVLELLKVMKPRAIAFENVVEWADFFSWTRVLQPGLEEMGYIFSKDNVVQGENYFPQARKRFMPRACLNQSPPPLAMGEVGFSWKDVITPFLPILEKTTLTKKQSQALSERSIKTPKISEAYLLLQRIGYTGSPIIRTEEEPCFTLRAGVGSDGKGGSRTNVLNVLTPEGKCFKISPNAFAALSGFPVQWFQLPSQTEHAFAGAGLAVLPPVARAIAQSLVPILGSIPNPEPIKPKDVALTPMKPFLKYVGGKTHLVPLMKTIYSKIHPTRRWFDLFGGSGALPLALCPDRVFLGDNNPDLINLWSWMQSDAVPRFPFIDKEEHYYEVREKLRNGEYNDAERAQAFYYLMRTSWNSLCRYNGDLQFNTPYNNRKGDALYLRPDEFQRYKDAIAHWEIAEGDFEDLLELVDDNDFVYADPPYMGTFTQYYTNFTEDDQIRLAKKLSEIKVPVVVSNSADPKIIGLYKKLGFDLTIITAPRSCDSKKKPDTKVPEMIATRNLFVNEAERVVFRRLRGRGATLMQTIDAILKAR